MAKHQQDEKSQFATPEDIEQALESLSIADERRLRAFAQYRIRGLGRKALGRDHEDLMGEAVAATWAGATEANSGRRWRKDAVGFVQHLLGAMRSVSSHWKEGASDDEPWLNSEVATENENGEVESPLENFPSDDPTQERTLLAKEELGRILRLFNDDDEAVLVLEGMREGYTGPEIMKDLGISRQHYEAALKRIRYKIR